MSDDADGRTADRAPAGAVLAELDELEVQVERLVSGGDGLARIHGVPIFVPLSAPGDRLLVRLTERRPDYGRAKILEVLEPGAGRREPPCPHFSRCGGCDLQHLEDGMQTELKAAAVAETFNRLARLPLPDDVQVIAGDAWGYRMRTRLHTAVSPAGVRLGYYERGTHSLVPVETCPVCRPELEQALMRLAATLGEAAPKRVDLACGDAGEITSAPVVKGFPHGEVAVSVAGLDLAFDARCFFQAHRGLLEDLLHCVVGEWRGDRAFDLYGGIGLFALACAAHYEAVTMIEGDRVAARYARINARRNRTRNVDVVAQAVESWVVKLPTAIDRVIVDPPRAGLAPGVRQVLMERSPRRLTYVSCHPAAMARDLRELIDGFEIERVTLLDLFPQTGHIEAVAQLTSRDAA